MSAHTIFGLVAQALEGLCAVASLLTQSSLAHMDQAQHQVQDVTVPKFIKKLVPSLHSHFFCVFPALQGSHQLSSTI